MTPKLSSRCLNNHRNAILLASFFLQLKFSKIYMISSVSVDIRNF